MPNPANYSNTKKDYQCYMRDCMHQTLHVERKDRAHGLGLCLNRWRLKHGPKKPGKAPKKMAQDVALQWMKIKISSDNSP